MFGYIIEHNVLPAYPCGSYGRIFFSRLENVIVLICSIFRYHMQVSLRILISIVWMEIQKWGSGENGFRCFYFRPLGLGSRCES